MAVVYEDRSDSVVETITSAAVPKWRRSGPRHTAEIEVFRPSGGALARCRMLVARGWHVVRVGWEGAVGRGGKPGR